METLDVETSQGLQENNIPSVDLDVRSNGDVKFTIMVNNKAVGDATLESEKNNHYKLGAVNSFAQKKGYGTKIIEAVSEFLSKKKATASATLHNDRLENVFKNNGWHKIGNFVIFGIDITRKQEW